MGASKQMRLVAHRPVPVLGVNLGNLGFLVEIHPDELSEALDRLETDDITLEQHSALLVRGTGEELALIIAPLAPMAGIGRPMVVSASEAIRLELLPESGRAAIEVDGLKLLDPPFLPEELRELAPGP